MKALPTVTYAFIWPMWLRQPFSGDAIPVELSEIVQDDRIVFFLKQEGYMQENEWYWKNKVRYICMSCAEANEKWETSEFKILESGNIPLHIEEEIRDHVDNHVKFGTWGVMKWRERGKANCS